MRRVDPAGTFLREMRLARTESKLSEVCGRAPSSSLRATYPEVVARPNCKFGWTSRFRRWVRDYKRLPETLASFHLIAFAVLMVKRFVEIRF